MTFSRFACRPAGFFHFKKFVKPFGKLGDKRNFGAGGDSLDGMYRSSFEKNFCRNDPSGIMKALRKEIFKRFAFNLHLYGAEYHTLTIIRRDVTDIAIRHI